MAKWMVAAKKADFNQIAQDYRITPVLARIMRNRDITEEEDIRKFLRGDLTDLHNPFLLKDMEQAVSVLLEKIENGASIRIIGDYDVDGICATYILLRGLKVLRPGLHLGTIKKNRFEPSHALALALHEEDVCQSIELSAGELLIKAYLTGQTFPVSDKNGWCLITVDSYSIGWGKAAGGILKNHYPKGLRKSW